MDLAVYIEAAVIAIVPVTLFCFFLSKWAGFELIEPRLWNLYLPKILCLTKKETNGGNWLGWIWHACWQLMICIFLGYIYTGLEDIKGYGMGAILGFISGIILSCFWGLIFALYGRFNHMKLGFLILILVFCYMCLGMIMTFQLDAMQH